MPLVILYTHAYVLTRDAKPSMFNASKVNSYPNNINKIRVNGEPNGGKSNHRFGRSLDSLLCFILSLFRSVLHN